MNSTLIEKFRIIKDELTAEFGELGLFALNEREEATDRWDVMLAAYWIMRDDYQLLSLITAKIQSKLNDDEIMLVSGVILMDADNILVSKAIKAVMSNIKLDGGATHIQASAFDGIFIHNMYVLSSNHAALTRPKSKSVKYEPQSTNYVREPLTK